MSAAPHSGRVYLIGCGTETAADGSVNELGFKAYNLVRMRRLGLPVPEAVVLGTSWCREFQARGARLPEGTPDQLLAALAHLESASGLRFGGTRRPLLVSVRSGAPVSMPGILETVLNVGLCAETLSGLLRSTGNPRLVWDSYRRLIECYGEVVLGLDPGAFARTRREALAAASAAALPELDFRSLRTLALRQLEVFEALAGGPFPQSPIEQLQGAIAAVFRSWQAEKARFYREAHGIDAALGTAVCVQRMVFGNAGGASGAGVGFTRDPATGEAVLYVDYVANAQGEDVVSGRVAVDATGLEQLPPPTRARLAQVSTLLEREFRDAQEFEFTVQDGELFMLQTRDAKRTPLAALRIAVELAEAGLVTGVEAHRRIATLDPAELETVSLAGVESARPLAIGLSASVGVASGAAVCNLERARARARAGEAVILVRDDLTTSDIAALEASVGVLSARGARTAHAAVVARQLGKVCIVNCPGLEVREEQGDIRFGLVRLAEGTPITLDGQSGCVYEGVLSIKRSPPTELLARLERLR